MTTQTQITSRDELTDSTVTIKTGYANGARLSPRHFQQLLTRLHRIGAEFDSTEQTWSVAVDTTDNYQMSDLDHILTLGWATIYTDED